MVTAKSVMSAIFGRFWSVRCFPPEVKSSVKGLRMSKDSKGVVFDLPSDLSDVVKVCSSDIFKQCVCWGVWVWVCNLLATKVFIAKLLLQDECRWS